MKPAITKLLSTLFFLATALPFKAQTKHSEFAPPQNPTHISAYEKGRNIFLSRCAKCHNEDASKKLPDGTTLVQRLAASQDAEALLGTRLKDAQERHAVMLYMDKIMVHCRSSEGSKKLPTSSPDSW
jgi:mono/diheme cytochrome c family protein